MDMFGRYLAGFVGALRKAAAERGPADPALARAEALFKDYLTVRKHVARPGEVMSGVARRYGVPLGDLVEYNGGGLFLRPGQVVRIPPDAGGGQKGGRGNGRGNGRVDKTSGMR